MHKIEKLRAQTNACVLNLLLPTKSGYALVYTERLRQAIFQRFPKN